MWTSMRPTPSMIISSPNRIKDWCKRLLKSPGKKATHVEWVTKAF